MTIRTILFSLEDILSKIVFIKEFILPQSLMFYRGVFSFSIHCFIIFPIVCFCGQFNFYQNILNILSEPSLFINIIGALFPICFIFLENLILMKIIYIFSPIHVCFINIIVKTFQYIVFNPQDKLTPISKIVYILSLIIIFFGELLFCEIIIINKFGLNNNTKSGFLHKL